MDKKDFSKETLVNLERGQMMEPIIRDYHFKKVGKDVSFVREIGLAIFKEDCRFRGSADGEIGEDGCAEYKAPKKMYSSLIRYIENPTPGYSHIPTSHLDQMTTNCIILDKKWCDYYVMSEDGMIFSQRVYTDHDLWKEIFSKATKFYENYIIPIMEQYHLKLENPEF